MMNAGLMKPSGKEKISPISATSCREAPRRVASQPVKKPSATAKRMRPIQIERNIRKVLLYEFEPFAALGSTLSGYTHEAVSGSTYLMHKTRIGSQRRAAYALSPRNCTTIKLAPKPSGSPTHNGADERPILALQAGHSIGRFLRSSRFKGDWQAGHVH